MRKKYVNHVDHDMQRAAEVIPGTKLTLIKNSSGSFLRRGNEYTVFSVYPEYVPGADGEK